MKNLLIIGAGKFGREVFTWAQQCIENGEKWKIKGFLHTVEKNSTLKDWTQDLIIGDPINYEPTKDDIFLCAIGDPKQKEKYVFEIEKKNGVFTNLIHPTSCIGDNVRFGNGCIFCPFTQASCDITLENYVTIGTQTSLGHDVCIGKWSQLSSHCAINGNVHIGKRVFLGAGCIIVPGKKIEDDCYVGAGSVVINNVKSGDRLFGNPATTI